MTIQTIATISNSFKTFLQNGNYESAILTLMNESSRVFPHSYEHNEKQSHGECDFFSYATYMGQYTDMMQKFEKWENEDLNTAEIAYYVDLQARTTKKLLEVA